MIDLCKAHALNASTARVGSKCWCHFPVFGSSFIMLYRHTCAEFSASSCPMVTRKENTKSYRHIVGQFSKGQHTSKATTALLFFSFGITQIQSVPTHAYHQQPVFVMEDCAHGPDNPALKIIENMLLEHGFALF